MDNNLKMTNWKIGVKKQYKFDSQKVNDLADYGTVIWAIADQIRFTEDYKQFDKIKHLLREE